MNGNNLEAFCRKCGSKFEETSKFCRDCGKQRNGITMGNENQYKIEENSPYIVAGWDYSELLEGNLKNYEAWWDVARSLLSMKLYDESEKAFYKAIELDSSNPLVWTDMGLLYQVMKNSEKAEEVLLKAINLQDKKVKKQLESDPIDPRYSIAWHLYGNLLYSTKRFEEARKAYEASLQFNSDHYENWFNLGDLLIKMELVEDAEPVLQKCVEFKPENLDNRMRLAFIYKQQRKYPQVINQLDIALALAPPDWHLRQNAITERENVKGLIMLFGGESYIK